MNTAFYPKLMWNGRFFANAAPGKKLGDPFSNKFGFTFPAPEVASLGYHDHLLQAQAFIPPTELVEVAGFTGTSDTDLSPRFEVFDNGKGCRCRCRMGRDSAISRSATKAIETPQRDAGIPAGVRQSVS